ncbi:MAG: hypothetical protein ACK55I_05480, partial [bacterium]
MRHERQDPSIGRDANLRALAVVRGTRRDPDASVGDGCRAHHMSRRPVGEHHAQFHLIAGRRSVGRVVDLE